MKSLAKILVPLLLLFVSCDKEKEDYSDDLKLQIDNIDLVADNEKEFAIDQYYNRIIEGKNDSLHRSLLLRLCGKYYNNKFYNKYALASQKLYDLSVIERDTFQMANALYYIGDYYEVQFKPDSTLHYYTQAEKLYRKVKDTINSGKLQLYKAGILHDTGNFSESEVETIKALSQLKNSKNKRLIYECYLLIALSLKDQHKYSQSLDYFNQALYKINEIEEDAPNTVAFSRASCYNNIGLLYETKEDYNKAIELYGIALGYDNLKKGKPLLYSMLLSNMAYSQMQLGIRENTKEMLDESFRIRDSLNSIPGIVSSDIRIGEYYLLQQDTFRALGYLKKGYRLSKDIKSHYDILKSLKLLSQADKNKAYYSNLYFKVSDSLQYVERSTRDKFARIAYETNAVENKYRDLIKRNIITIIFSICIISLIIGCSIVLNLRSKNKALKQIQEQQTANEGVYQLIIDQQIKAKHAKMEERERIGRDLHDGIINRIFITRYNLMKSESIEEDFKNSLVQELVETEEEIRVVSHNLIKNFKDNGVGFSEMLYDLVGSQKNQFSTVFDIYIDKLIEWDYLSGEIKMHLYKIVQESLNNVNKYSESKRCHVLFVKVSNTLKLEVADDGKGFNRDMVKSGIGLKNIAERVYKMSGTLEINSVEGEGTKLKVQLPLFASFVILMLIVGLSISQAPILNDQPEDNLDNRSNHQGPGYLFEE